MKKFHKSLLKYSPKNIMFISDTKFTSVSKDVRDNDKIHVNAMKKDKSAEELCDLVSDQLLVAVGRIPNSDTLDT